MSNGNIGRRIYEELLRKGLLEFEREATLQALAYIRKHGHNVEDQAIEQAVLTAELRRENNI